MSQIFKHGLALYDELSRVASKSEDGHFYGSMVAAFQSTGASASYYTRLFRTLEEKGCIDTLVAGRGGGRPSDIVLIRPPIEEDFKLVPKSRLTKSPTDDIIGQRIRNIERRLPDIDLGQLLQDYEKRISALESEHGMLSREVQRIATPQAEESS